MTDYEKARAELDATLDALGVTLAAQLVPFSQSRNAGESRASINWRVVVIRSNRPQYACDYSQGVGHLPPAYRDVKRCGSPRSIMADGIEREACEKGQASGFPAVVPPAVADVLASLLMEAQAYGQTFSEWAGDFGYNDDSREAERLYLACVETGRAMAKLFTPQEIETLRELCELAGL
jgi:hypothetical protein